MCALRRACSRSGANGKRPNRANRATVSRAQSQRRVIYQNRKTIRYRTRRLTMPRKSIILPALIFSLAIAGLAQTRPRLTPADYGKWETLGATSLSPDGKWLAYG